MQRTIRVLRIALPIVFFGFVLLLVLSWDRSAGRKEKPRSEPVTSTQRPADTPKLESKTFEDVQTIGGRVVSRIHADRLVAFESGWTTLESVKLTLYRENGLTYEVTCPRAEFNAQTKEAEAKGGVRVASSDGVEIATAEIRYDGARLTNDIPVMFQIDRWKGNAGALDLDVQAETMRLHKNVTATMASSGPAEQPLEIRGEESFFRRRDDTVEFHRHVEMNRGPDNVHADSMLGRLSADHKQLVGLEGNGHCVIVMAAKVAPGEELGGRKTITCEGFFSEVDPEGRLKAINATSGESPVHAVLDGPPKRDIVAREVRVELTGRVVSQIQANFAVEMRELDTQRQINTEHATVWFDEATRKARAALFDGAFRYTDPKTTATAFRANYDILGDRIVLTTDAGWQATVVSDGQTVKAKQIEFSPRAQTAHAEGSVIARLTSQSKSRGPSVDATGLFPAGKPVFVNADDLMMRQATGVASFTGNVKAWQEKNTLLAGELQVQGNGEVVTARNNVRTLLYNTTAEERKTPMQSRSEQLVARKSERRVDLTGKVSIQDETRNLTAEKATFFFDANRKIERIETAQNVVVTEAANGRKGKGDKAVYQVAKKMIYLDGSPAVVSDPTGNISGQQIVFDLARNRVRINSPDEPMKGTYKHEGG